jgi:peroxiredoxin Q/BCP
MATLNPGDIAPDFQGKDQNGKEIALSDFQGKKLVLYFYPKDDTPGCTKEACSFRDHYTDLQDAGYAILGVSADSEAKHQKFIEKYNLPFPLLADENKEVIQAYGAWGLKKFMGKEYEGIIRMTYVIGPDSKIEHVIKKVKTKEAAEQMLAL